MSMQTFWVLSWLSCSTGNLWHHSCGPQINRPHVHKYLYLTSMNYVHICVVCDTHFPSVLCFIFSFFPSCQSNKLSQGEGMLQLLYVAGRMFLLLCLETFHLQLVAVPSRLASLSDSQLANLAPPPLLCRLPLLSWPLVKTLIIQAFNGTSLHLSLSPGNMPHTRTKNSNLLYTLYFIYLFYFLT